MTHPLRRQVLIGGIAAALASTLSVALAQNLTEGRTAQDRRFVAGGVGLEESEHLKAMAPGFPLTIVVASPTGAYLADTHVTIRDARSQPVLDTQLYSPYLLVDLAPGRYDIEATHHGMRKAQRVAADASSRSRVVFTFDVPVDQVSQSPVARPSQ